MNDIQINGVHNSDFNDPLAELKIARGGLEAELEKKRKRFLASKTATKKGPQPQTQISQNPFKEKRKEIEANYETIHQGFGRIKKENINPAQRDLLIAKKVIIPLLENTTRLYGIEEKLSDTPITEDRMGEAHKRAHALFDAQKKTGKCIFSCNLSEANDLLPGTMDLVAWGQQYECQEFKKDTSLQCTDEQVFDCPNERFSRKAEKFIRHGIGYDFSNSEPKVKIEVDTTPKASDYQVCESAYRTQKQQKIIKSFLEDSETKGLAQIVKKKTDIVLNPVLEKIEKIEKIGEGKNLLRENDQKYKEAKLRDEEKRIYNVLQAANKMIHNETPQCFFSIEKNEKSGDDEKEIEQKGKRNDYKENPKTLQRNYIVNGLDYSDWNKSRCHLNLIISGEYPCFENNSKSINCEYFAKRTEQFLKTVSDTLNYNPHEEIYGVQLNKKKKTVTETPEQIKAFNSLNKDLIKILKQGSE